MHTIKNWSKNYNIPVIMGNNNVYPVKYVQHVFGKILKEETIQCLEKQNMFGSPMQMVMNLARMNYEDMVDYDEIIAKCVTFFNALSYLPEHKGIIIEHNGSKYQIKNVTDETLSEYYMNGTFAKVYFKLNPSDAMAEFKYNLSLVAERTPEQLEKFIESNKVLISMLEGRHIIVYKLNDQPRFIPELRDLSVVKKEQPCFPLKFDSTGKIGYADTSLSKDSLLELSIL